MKTCKLSLIPLEKKHIPLMTKWRASKRISNQMFSNDKITEDSTRIWYDKYIDSGLYKYFIINLIAEDVYVGVTGLHNLDRINGTANLDIYIGDERYLHKGIAYEALKLFLSIAKINFNLRKIRAELFLANKNAYNLYIKAGFSVEGILKEEKFKHGKYQDILEMAVFL